MFSIVGGFSFRSSFIGLELGEELLTAWFLAFLVIAWLIVFVPAARRARHRTPLTAVQGFKRRMRLIAPRTRGGRWIVVPEPRDLIEVGWSHRVQQRRMAILIGLLALAIATALWAIFSDATAAFEIHLVVDAAAAFYVALLIDGKRRRAERSVKVRPLASAPSTKDAPVSEPLEASGGRRA